MSQPKPGTTEPVEVDENSIFVKKIGVNSKGRMYGMGSQRRMYSAGSGLSSQARVDRVDLENAALKKKIVELEKSVKEKQQAMQAQIEAEVSARVSMVVQAQVQTQVEIQMKMLCEKFIPGWKPPGSS